MECPKCGIENDDNWPLEINDKIVDGGCEECWAKEIDAQWWQAVDAFPDKYWTLEGYE